MNERFFKPKTNYHEKECIYKNNDHPVEEIQKLAGSRRVFTTSLEYALNQCRAKITYCFIPSLIKSPSPPANTVFITNVNLNRFKNH